MIEKAGQGVGFFASIIYEMQKLASLFSFGDLLNREKTTQLNRAIFIR